MIKILETLSMIGLIAFSCMLFIGGLAFFTGGFGLGKRTNISDPMDDDEPLKKHRKAMRKFDKEV